ncbi:MAG TPA: hypothetical protein VF550_13425 [Polyangia bacterium]
MDLAFNSPQRPSQSPKRQRTALMLRDRGVVLAVSSKNTDEIARQPFRKHPEMLLRQEHIAVFQANWNDKATNIKAIAKELSLGLDAMVLLDDNPVERGLVRQLLPQVAVPELPDDPALFARTLLAAGYFEAIAFSGEDRQRAEFYQNNSRRVELQKQAGDVDAYLASLNMQMTLQPFDDTGRARIAQLINKSNQFNLTTRRYTEAEVRARGVRRLVGRYLPTEKNKLVEDHYAKLGFALLEAQNDGSTRWELQVDDAPVASLPFAVQRVGFASPAARPELASSVNRSS